MQQEKRGRSKPRTPGTYQRVTLELPIDLWQYITQRTDNRTAWIKEAITEKRDREIGKESKNE